MPLVATPGRYAPLRALLRLVLWLALGMALHLALSLLLFASVFLLPDGRLHLAASTLVDLLSFPRPRPWDSVVWGAVFAVLLLAMRRARGAT